MYKYIKETTKNPFDEILAKSRNQINNSFRGFSLNPLYLDLEFTNNCNFTCSFCPTGLGFSRRPKGNMKREVFSTALAEIKKTNIPIRIVGWGEPTLHLHWIDYIKELKESSIFCHLTTNGSMIDNHNARLIVDCSLDVIRFSFQGATSQSYMEMRNRNFFDELMNKIAYLHQIRGANKRPYIHIATTISYESESQINDFISKAIECSDLVTVGRTILTHLKIDKIKCSSKEREVLRRMKNDEMRYSIRPIMCTELFTKLSINWDGTVSACCADFSKLMKVGDITESSLTDIWLSPELFKHRTDIHNKHYTNSTLCSHCFEYQKTIYNNYTI